MQWGDSERDHHNILAVWPSYRPLNDVWHMQEFAEREPLLPVWRDRRVPTEQGHVRGDIYRDEAVARENADRLNPILQREFEERGLDPIVAQSMRLKVSKALQSKKRHDDEEKLMLAEGIRRHSNTPRIDAKDLILAPDSEFARDQIASALAEMPYLKVVLIRRGYNGYLCYREKDDNWTKPYYASRQSAEDAHRAKIANAFGMSGTDHWGKAKAKIRELLLPRANQLLQLASVQRMLADALACGEKMLVVGSWVFWYEEDGGLGWQIKSVSSSESHPNAVLWEEGTILSKNHGRLVILPYLKDTGEKVSGHTKNGPHDGPAKPRHPTQYVNIPFRQLNSDLMIGLLGELPYE
jgi:hypothetical protein